MTIPTARERIARIIDPDVWRSWDRDQRLERQNTGWKVEPSLAKADLILSEQAGEGGGEKFEAHTRAVAEFLNELYAIMVDPCAEGSMTVDKIKAAGRVENDQPT